MKINNVKFDFDVMDANIALLVEKEMDILANTKVPEGASWSQVIIIQCESTFKFFDSVFGEGASKKIFGGKTNLNMCLDAIDQFKKEFDRDVKVATNNVKSKLGMYSANRAQRRNNK